MKLFNTITAGLLLCAGLASCEMKDELKGGSEGSSDMGYLNLGVAVNASQNTVSRSDVTDDGEVDVVVDVNADDFPVVITGKTDASFSKEYASYAALQEEGPVLLPVGTYTVTAHSNLEEKNQMTEPFYEGTSEVNITKGSTANADVICKMKNMKLALIYGSGFTTNFTSWTITVTDGKTVVTFTCTDNQNPDQVNPAPVYWMVAEETQVLTVTAQAVNLKGEKVEEVRTLSKPVGSYPSYWEGSDVLNITMEQTTPDEPTGITGSGIVISADIEFEEENETVTIPVTPGTVPDDEPGTKPEPGEPGDDTEETAPTITLPQSVYTLPDDLSADADVVIETALKKGSTTDSVGIKSVFVKIKPGNEGFEAALNLLLPQNVDFITEGVDLVTNPNVSGLIGMIAPGLDMPTPNAPSYVFPVGKFFSTLGSADMGVTNRAGGHTFDIIVTDNNGKTATASLSIIVNSVE